MNDLDKCSVPFSQLCEFMEKLNRQKGKNKVNNLKKFFKSNVKSFFPIIRLMVPSYDMERGQYGLKETTLGKLYAELLNLPTREKEALIFYKNPNKQFEGCPAGGFVEVLEFILSKRIGASKNLSVEEVNILLDKLANAIDKAEKKKVLRELLCSMSSMEQKWLVKIILKDMKLGTHDKILGLYHEKALEIYFHTNNLREVFIKLRDKSTDLSSHLYTLGQPIRPMLAGRKPYQELKKLLTNAEVFVETKFDGERIQCHFTQNDDFFLYSRNAVDYTNMYSKALKDVITNNIKGLRACILDGELIVWDIENMCQGRFGQNKTVALEDTPGKTLCYKVFDILYMETANGECVDLMPRPIVDRKALLEKHINSVQNKFEVVKSYQVKGAKAVFDLFNKAIEENEEGLIVKRMDSPYIADDRSNLWLKLKSEYFEALSDTLDLLIVGGYYGSGFRAGGDDEFDHITVFLCAVASKIDLKDPSKSKYIPVTKVGTGYSLHELAEIRRGLKDQWKAFRQSPDYWPKWVPGSGERPDYYIKDPSKSIILELKAAEIVPTEKFPSNFTLRFPKVHKIRYDKNWDQATTLSEFNGIMDTFARGLTEKTAKIEEAHKKDASKVPRKRKREIQVKGEVLQAFRDTDTQGIIVNSDLFQGLEFFIAKAQDKPELEKLIVEYGGNKVQNFLSSTNYVIASDKNSIRIQNLIEKRDIDIIFPKWVLDCVKYGQILDFRPQYICHASSGLQTKFDNEFTKYGNSLNFIHNDHNEVLELAQKVSQNDIKLMVKLMGNPWWSGFSEELIKDLRLIPAYTFLGYTFYIPDIGLESELCKTIVLSRHGNLSPIPDEKTTHFLCLVPDYYEEGNWSPIDKETFYNLVKT